MDINTLKALGISPEELGSRIVDQAVETLLNTTGFNPDTEEETRYESRFKREIEARVKQAVDDKIAALAQAPAQTQQVLTIPPIPVAAGLGSR